MNKDKQIEEMPYTQDEELATIISNYFDGYLAEADIDILTDIIVANGYRKTSDIASEIFAEIEKEINLAIDSNYRAKKEHKNHSVIPNYDNFNAMCDGKIYAMRGLLDFIKELQEKKYTEDGK